MSPPGACFSSKRRGKCHHRYLCNYSSFIIKYRVPPLPVPAWGLSACETPSASNDGQSNTPYLAMSLGELTGLMLHVGWTGSAPRKSTHIPGARMPAEGNGTAERKFFSIQAQRSISFLQSGRGQYILLGPLASHVARTSGWPVWTLSQNLEITKLFACWIAIYILYK